MGKLIALEGCTGAGKSTQFKLLQQKLYSKGINYCAINELDYEPCKSAVQNWRSSDLGKRRQYDKNTIISLAQARATMHKHFLADKLANSDIVLLDRSYITNAVYQLGFGFTYDEIIKIHMDLGVLPLDRVFILHCMPKTSFHRAYRRNHTDFLEGGGYEMNNERFMVPVEEMALIEYRRNVYFDIACTNENFSLINTENSVPENVCNHIISEIFTV